jgi:hypothetical protein
MNYLPPLHLGAVELGPFPLDASQSCEDAAATCRYLGASLNTCDHPYFTCAVDPFAGPDPSTPPEGKKAFPWLWFGLGLGLGGFALVMARKNRRR